MYNIPADVGQPVADRQGEGMHVSPRKNYILFNASVPLLNTDPGADIKRLYPRNLAYLRCMKKSLITKPLTVYILYKTEHVKYLRVFR